MTRTSYLLLAPMMLSLSCVPPGGSTSGGGGGSTSGGVSSRCGSANYGASAAARKVSTFIRAAADFTERTAVVETQMVSACRAMGAELGMTGAELNGDVQGVCNAVSMKIREEMAVVRGSSEVNVAFEATPPRCSVEVNAYADCAAECDINIDRGEIQVECEGGQLVGRCSAECTGECNVQVQGQCSGSCEGTCNAGCTGTCNGVCEGECSARGPDGQCAGSCTGTCHGTCDAGCQGSCEGDCWVSGQASCDAECRGGCSVDYEAPRCTGTTRAPSVDADCHASCEASLSAEARCEPGRAEFVVSGGMSAEAQASLDRVRGAVRAGWNDFIGAAEEFRRLLQSGRRLVAATRNLRGTGQAVAQSAVCMAQALVAIPQAMARVEVSVSVQVEMSASVSASAG